MVFKIFFMKIALSLVIIGSISVVCPISVMAVDFETIRSNMKTMTTINWKDYCKSLEGTKIRWSGWISDVEKQWSGGYKIMIDMDPPDSLSVQDIYINDVDKRFASQFNKNQKVVFSGIIESVKNILGSCSIHLIKAKISPAR